MNGQNRRGARARRQAAPTRDRQEKRRAVVMSDVGFEFLEEKACCPLSVRRSMTEPLLAEAAGSAAETRGPPAHRAGPAFLHRL